MKKILFLLLVVLIPVALFQLNGNSDTYDLFLVESGELISTVEATGSLESTDSAAIKPPRLENTWRLTISYMAPEGQMVTTGMPLLRFDAQEFQKRLELKKSQIASRAKRLEITRLEEKEKLELAELELAEREAELSKALRKAETPSGLIAGVELKKAEYDAQLAQIKVDTAKRKVRVQKENMQAAIRGMEASIKTQKRLAARLEENVESMTVKSPKDGLLIYKPKYNGEKYTAGETAWINTTLMEIPDLTSMVISGVIDEPDAGKVAIGQNVDIRLDANPDRLFKGKIISLGKVFHRKSRKTPNIVFDARISIEKPDPEFMRPGMAARMEILTERIPNVIRIPSEAMAFDDEGPYVRVKGKGKRRIKPGRRVGDMIVVLEGLENGQRIMVPKAVEKGGEA